MLDIICLLILILYFLSRPRDALERENAILRLRIERVLLEVERERMVRDRVLAENL